MYRFALPILLACFAASAAAADDPQTLASEQGEITVHPVEHATFVLQAGDKRIALDPVGGGDTGSAFEGVDLALLTDIHGDHFDAATLTMLAGQGASIVAPAAQAVLEMQPRVVYPYHYRGQNGLSDVDRFAQLVQSENPDIEVRQLDWYPE